MTTLQSQGAPTGVPNKTLWRPSSNSPLGLAFALNAIKALNSFAASEQNIRIEVSTSSSESSSVIADKNIFLLLNLIVGFLTSHCANSTLAISMRDKDGRAPCFTIRLTQNRPWTPATSDGGRAQTNPGTSDAGESLDWVCEESFYQMQRLAQSLNAKLTCERISRHERHLRVELITNEADSNYDYNPTITLPVTQEDTQAKHILIATSYLDDIWQTVEAQSGSSCIVSRVNNMCEANEVARYFKIDVLLVDGRTMGNSDASAMLEFESYRRATSSPCQIFLYGKPRVIAARRVTTLGRIFTGLNLEYNAERSWQADCCFEILSDFVAGSESAVTSECDILDFDFDADRLGELIGILQTSKFKEASRQFLVDIAQLVDIEPEQALQANSGEYLGLFHKLGSSAGFFGALELRNICYDLQESLIQTDQATRRTKLSSFKVLARSTERQLGKFNDLLQVTF
jgi:HPt (histidine-containing phosphotransfer) domain-containing protein